MTMVDTVNSVTRAPRMIGQVRYRTNFKNTLYDVMRLREWKEADNEFDWDLVFIESINWIRIMICLSTN